LSICWYSLEFKFPTPGWLGRCSGLIQIKSKYERKYGEIILAKDNGSWRKEVIKEYKKSWVLS